MFNVDPMRLIMAIKKLQNNYTTPLQSKLLLKLGLPADSADCYLQNESQDPLAYVNYTAHIIQPFHDKRVMFSQMEDFLPCWSVGRLIEIYEICANAEYDRDCSRGLVEDVIYIIERDFSHNMLDFSKLEE
jgi:hypothetical protein